MISFPPSRSSYVPPFLLPDTTSDGRNHITTRPRLLHPCYSPPHPMLIARLLSSPDAAPPAGARSFASVPCLQPSTNQLFVCCCCCLLLLLWMGDLACTRARLAFLLSRTFNLLLKSLGRDPVFHYLVSGRAFSFSCFSPPPQFG